MFRIIPRNLFVEPRATVVSIATEGDETEAALRIDGLLCSACAANVQSRFERVAGVRAARVDLARGQALVRYQAGRVGPGALVRAVEGAIVLRPLRRLIARLARPWRGRSPRVILSAAKNLSPRA